MAVPYVRLSILGTLPGGEVFSVNPAFIGNFTGDGQPSHAELLAWLAQIDATVAFPSYTSLMGAMSSSAAITGYRLSVYGTDGRLSDQAEQSTSQPIAGTSTLKLPTTAAVVLSLGTGIPGRSYRGRLFWPGLGLSLSSDTGRISGQVTQGMANDAADMLSDLAAAGPSTYDPVPAVYSQTRGAGTAITQVRVGDVVDSQRGRKSALSDLYASAVVTQ